MNIFEALSGEEVLNALPDPVLILDQESRIEFVNDAFASMLGYEKNELVGTTIVDYLYDTSIFESCVLDLQTKGYCNDQETLFTHRNGHPVSTIKNVRMMQSGQGARIFVNIRNICHIDTVNKQLRHSEQLAKETANQLSQIISTKEQELVTARMQLDEVLSTINEIIWYIDDQSLKVQYVSTAAEKIFGVVKEKFIETPGLWQEMIYSEDRERVMGFFMNLQPGSSQTIDFRIQRPDGEIRWLNNRVVHHSGMNFFIGVTIDITETKKNQDMIEFMAYHDTLTNLPNRAYLKKQIETLLARAAIVHQHLAILFLDLDNFKYINDTMGHEVGDGVLVEVAQRLSGTLGPKSTCTRFGGDEFIVLLSDIHDPDDIKQQAEALIRAFRAPFLINEHEFFISCSIGIALYPDHSLTATDLIKHADTAMYAAKKTGKNRYVYYNPQMDAHVNEFLRIENLIREGINNRMFQLHYQPLIDANTHKLEGFEALLRFFHPSEGYVSPFDFIPVAEATGDILTLSRFVLGEACRFIQQLNYETGSTLFVAVNISTRQFREEHFADNFLKTLHQYDIPAEFIKIEVTESLIMENIDIAASELETLKQAGVRIALDDFGTGYSSFEYLARLPIDTIKIDKSFVIDLFNTETNRHIIEAVTKLAHAMGKEVIAEGVESSEHAIYLQSHGINLLQGFAISKAIDAATIFRQLKHQEPIFTLNEPSNFSI